MQIPNELKAIPKDVERRFWSKVEKTDGCWVWRASTSNRGYGKFNLLGRLTGSHRVAWMLVNGAIPPDLYVLHRCDNPPCVNPAHLYLGTHRENMADMRAKNRSAFGLRNGNRTHPEKRQRGEANPLARLTTETVIEVRHLAADGVPQCEIVRRLNVSKSNVSAIINRKIWRHV